MRGSRSLTVCLLAATLAASPLSSATACPSGARPSPALAMEAGARAFKEGRPVRILAIGSSTTAGVGASGADQNYPSQLARRLVDAWGEGRVEITNAGVSGETGPSTLGRLQSFMRATPAPHLVIWQVGTNDVIFGGDPGRLKALVSEGLASIAASGAAAVVIDQQYFPAINDLARYEQFVSAVDAATSARGVPLLRRYAMMKQWATRDPAGFRGTLWWDSFHMNDAGYSCLAELLAPSILTAVRSGGAARPAAAPARPAPAASER
ncbi:SGNH/GDSL hydrolase family protein [Xanthobacter sp. KR7-65]|uniref:SGNH/GDSL hydrolase family protein n=1 Tax=Xanthobacter sp. KR7-65 TaxID=3156612 RepID=UPI0032B3C4C6